MRRKFLTSALLTTVAAAVGLTLLPPGGGGGASSAARDVALEAPAAPDAPPRGGSHRPPTARKNGVVDARLRQLHLIDVLARAQGRAITRADAARLPAELRAAIETHHLRLDREGRVLVRVIVDGDPANVLPVLGSLGMGDPRADGQALQGMLPLSAVEAAASIAGVTFVGPPEPLYVAAGSALTQGDAILDANDLRALYGVNGAGVRVGVVSDGLEGLAAAQSSGDLPAVNSATCDVIESAPAGEPANPTDAGAGAEGTALLEIVHDVAPGAELWFGYFGLATTTAGTVLDFNDAVDCLAANVDIVIDDIFAFNVGPYDGTSTMSQNTSSELNNASRRIRGHYTVAGNHALQHYQGSYSDIAPLDANYNLHRFIGTSTTTDGLALGAQDFDPVYLANGGIVVVQLSWNDAWGASSNDYDLYLGNDATLQIVASSTNVQDGIGGNDFPAETLAFLNTGPDGYFDILVDKWSGNVRTLDMFVSACLCAPLGAAGALHNYNTKSSSIGNQSDAGGGVLSLGAIDAAEPGNDLIEPFSSQGPTNDSRIKPDIVAIDGVNVSGAGGFPSSFFGTSAAAPHAGAIAALLLACKPSLKHGEAGDNPAADRTALRTALTGSALGLGAAGTDNIYGSGRIDADAAAAAAGCIAATPTPTATRTQTPTPTHTPAPAQDTDGDGCTDVEENGLQPEFGGDRDPTDYWDWFDVNGDQLIDLNDTLEVLARFGIGVGAPGYGETYDRYAPDPAKLYLTAKATDGLGIDLTDALTSLGSYGHDCSGPP